MASNFQILACEPTPLGLLCLRRRELLSRPGVVVTEITLDQAFLMSSYVTDSERALASVALEMHAGDNLKVLVGGLGLGYTANEVLVAGGGRVADVEVVEFLPQVIDWLANDLVPLAAALKADPRLRVVRADVYALLAAPPRSQFDLILIDVDSSPDERLGTQNAGFYSEAGLQQAKEHLNDDGILAVWSYEEDSPFSQALGRVFAEVRAVPITVVNDLVGEKQTDWLFFARK